jgi:Nucleotidyltransferase substrate binding protein like
VTLPLAPLVNAVDRLREGLVRHQLQAADELVLDGLIQRFVFTFEVCHRLLRRYLRETSDLTIKVDVLDLRAVDPAFKRIISSGMLPLQLGDAKT